MLKRELYDLENLSFENKEQFETAREFLEAGINFEIDKNNILWTEGGVFIGYVEYR